MIAASSADQFAAVERPLRSGQCRLRSLRVALDLWPCLQDLGRSINSNAKTRTGHYSITFDRRFARCSSKAKMSALSKVEMSVSAFWEFGGCHFDGHGGDEQARAEPS
jgi:hypothetical protein